MLLLLRLLCVFICTTWLSYASESATSHRSIFLTSQEFKVDPLFKEYELLDPGFPKTITTFENLPKNTKVFVSHLRPLFEKSGFQKMGEFILDKDNGQNDSDFILLISAKGFLPGERIKYRLATADGNYSYEFSFIANPVLVKDGRGNTVLEVELATLNPCNYALHLINCLDNEKIRMKSLSENEEIECPVKKLPTVLLYSPDVIGKKGGHSNLLFIRTNQETFSFKLPWGSELIPYFKGHKVYRTYAQIGHNQKSNP